MDFPEIVLNNGKNYFKHMNEVQQSFHASSAKFRWCGGAIGSGKSIMGCVEALAHSWEFPNNRGWIMRATYDEIEESVLLDFLEVCPPWMIFQHNQNKHWIDIVNKFGVEFFFKYRDRLKFKDMQSALRRRKGLSRISFRSFEGGTIHGEKKLTSSSIGWFFVDQAEESTEALHKELNRRLRRMPSALKGWYISNPDGHDWLWQFFSPDSLVHKKRHEMFQIETHQNKSNLPPDFDENLRETHTDEEYEQQVKGSFDVATGAIFPEFSPGIHVIPHVEPPDEWLKGVGLDPGLNNPTGIILAAKLPNGDIYIYWEWQEKEKLVSEVSQVLRTELTPEHRIRVIDREAAKRSQVTGTSVLDEYNRYGLPFMPSDADVWAGINRMKEYFKFDAQRKNPFTGAQGSPRVFISDRCPKLIQQLLSYKKEELKTQRGRSNVPEKPHKHNDHLIDAARYLWVKMTPPLSEASAIQQKFTDEVYGPLTKAPKGYMNDEGDLDISEMITEAHKPVRRQRTHWREY